MEGATMIVKCTAEARDCGHEWQTVANDHVCDWCGAPGQSIGSDYMSDCDKSITSVDGDPDEPSLLELLGTVEDTGLRVRRG
jgi:hypothetical protein